PIDFRPESEMALEYAASVAVKVGATLHLIYILEEESPLLKLVLKDDQRDMILRGAADKLDDAAGKVLTGKNIPFTTKIKQGKVYKMIIETAREVKADFIFMGRTDSSDMMKNFAGTNTMHIIRGADVPVITLRKKPEYFGCSHIILPLDLTKQTLKQASNAVAVARMLDARITIISILRTDSKSKEIKIISKLDEIRTKINSLDIDCDVKLIKNTIDAPHGILNDSVRELDGDLVMIMTQQELHITEYFIGSVAQDIINLSDFPVLSINPLVREEKGIPDPMAEVFINPIQMLDH
ncbi:MAG: universal stress protein, partial [Bacteroidales bacterium]|nr:universal stress protein [Bacteroidales bacterium]